MLHQHFERNTNGRDFIVGDIHGCFVALSRILEERSFDRTADRLFCVGDLVDRGPQSHQVTTWLEAPWFRTVRGNHEQLTIDAYHGGMEDRGFHVMNGGAWFQTMTPIERREIASLFEALPYALSVDTERGPVGIVHAEVLHNTWAEFLEDLNLERTQTSTMWGRYRHTYRDDRITEGVDRVYVGHTVILPETEQVIGNHHYLDTGGCFKEGFLTVREL